MMQTYLPYEDFKETARVLEVHDLATSISTSISILDCIHETVDGNEVDMVNRLPIVRMWRGREVVLVQYGETLLEEWYGRPSDERLAIDFMAEEDALALHMEWATSGEYSMDRPRWTSDTNLHLAHRAELIRHDPPNYAHVWPDLNLDRAMFWPVP